MGGVFAGFAVVGTIILVGYLAGRSGIAGPHAGPVLSRIAFFITNPALLFTILATSELHAIFSALVPVAFAAALTCLIYWGLSALWFRRIHGAVDVLAGDDGSVIAQQHGQMVPGGRLSEALQGVVSGDQRLQGGFLPGREIKERGRGTATGAAHRRAWRSTRSAAG